MKRGNDLPEDPGEQGRVGFLGGEGDGGGGGGEKCSQTGTNPPCHCALATQFFWPKTEVLVVSPELVQYPSSINRGLKKSIPMHIKKSNSEKSASSEDWYCV